MNSSPSIAASIGIGILIFLLVVSIVGIVFLRRYLRTLNGLKPSRKLGTSITPKDPPQFIIPPYTLLTEENDGGETVSENGEHITKADEITGKLSPPAFRRALSMPDPSGDSRSEEGLGGGTAGLSTKEYRPQYRRAVSQYAPYSAQVAKKKTSAAPYGKLEVSLQFVMTKNLLIVQVCLHTKMFLLTV